MWFWFSAWPVCYVCLGNAERWQPKLVYGQVWFYRGCTDHCWSRTKLLPEKALTTIEFEASRDAE